MNETEYQKAIAKFEAKIAKMERYEMAEELKTEIGQFRELADITKRLDIPITMSSNSIISLLEEIDALTNERDALCKQLKKITRSRDRWKNIALIYTKNFGYIKKYPY